MAKNRLPVWMLGMLAATFFAQGASDRLTYQNAGASARAILADLSATAHVRLEAAPETANEVLCLRCVNDSLTDVMKRIAWAVDGEWRANEAGYRLVRTPQQLLAEQKADLEIRVKAYQRGLDTLRSLIDSQGDFTPEAAAIQAQLLWPSDGPPASGRRPAPVQMPIVRAADRLAREIPAIDMAQIPPGGKVVYSSRPTAMQRPLYDGQVEDLREFLREQAIWADAAARARRASTTFRNATYGQMVDPIAEASVGRVLISLTKYGDDFGNVQVNVQIADRQGTPIVSQAINVNADLWSILPFPSASLLSQRISLPPDEAADGRALGWPPPTSPISASLMDRLLHPESHDPLAITQGEVLQRLSEQMGLPLVADLGDTVRLGMVGPKNQFLLDGWQIREIDRNPAPDWLGLRPAMPLRARMARADRAELGRFLRVLASPGHPTLDEEARFCQAMASAQVNGMPWDLVRTISRTSWHPGAQPYLRFYGLLDEPQRKAALGPGVRLGDLPAKAWNALSDIIYGAGINLTYTSPPLNASNARPVDFYGSIYREPTICFPDGLPPDGVFRLTAQARDGILAPSQLNGGTTFMLPSELAWAKFSADHPYIFGNGGVVPPRPSLGKVRFGSRSDFNFQFALTPSIATYFTVQSTRLSESDVKYVDLPEEFRAEVDRSYKQFEESFKQVQVSTAPTPGRVTPPP